MVAEFSFFTPSAPPFLYTQAYPRSTIAHNVLGVVYERMGRTEEAAQEFQRALDLARVPAVTDSSNATRALMILGRFGEAKKILDQWQQQRGSLDSSQMGQRYRIALFENDTATMERLARNAPADTFWLGLQQRLAFLRGDSGKLRSLSETLVNQQERAQRMENAADELGLARAYAMQGDHENSRKAYDDFFVTWKGADPNIPTLRQAKSEYAKLTATTSVASAASGKKQ